MMEIDVNQELKIKFEAGSIKGEDGITPHIGDNGNWYVGGTDTGVQATGERGEPGQPGYTPVKGKDYFDGQPGKDGRDGVDGKNGVDGKTPVKGVDYFDGKDGYTPVKGKDYFDGQPGKDGISPVINVSDIENGHRVTITTGSDVQSFDVLNGKDGEDAEGGTVEVDSTLSIEGMAADAKAVGEAVQPIAAITETTTSNKIEWDGVVGDKVTGEMMVDGIASIPLVRVSDYVPDVSVFTEQGITIGGIFEGNTEEIPMDAEEVENSIIHAENCYTMEIFTVALDDNVVAHIQGDFDSTITLPKKGVYFIQDNEEMSMRSLSSPLLEVPCVKVKPEALPDNIGGDSKIVVVSVDTNTGKLEKTPEECAALAEAGKMVLCSVTGTAFDYVENGAVGVTASTVLFTRFDEGIESLYLDFGADGSLVGQKRGTIPITWQDV